MDYIQFTSEAGIYILATIFWLIVAGLLGAGIYGLYSAIKCIFKSTDQ